VHLTSLPYTIMKSDIEWICTPPLNKLSITTPHVTGHVHIVWSKLFYIQRRIHDPMQHLMICHKVVIDFPLNGMTKESLKLVVEYKYWHGVTYENILMFW